MPSIHELTGKKKSNSIYDLAGKKKTNSIYDMAAEEEPARFDAPTVPDPTGLSSEGPEAITPPKTEVNPPFVPFLDPREDENVSAVSHELATQKPGLDFGEDIATVGRAIKELQHPTTEYMQRESEKATGELFDRLSWWKTYIASLGGHVGPKGLRKELLKEAEGFAGFGPALVPVAGETGATAIQWGVIYPKLFKLAGMGGGAISKIPQVQKATIALKSTGALQKLAKNHPHIYSAINKSLAAFGKGEVVGQTMAAIESFGKDKPVEEWLIDMNKRGAMMGGISTAFSLANSYDQYKYISETGRYLRLAAYNRHAERVNKGMNPTHSSEMGRQEGEKIKDILFYMEQEMLGATQEMYGGKKPKISPREAAKAFVDRGFVYGETGKTQKLLSSIKRPKETMDLDTEIKALKAAGKGHEVRPPVGSYQEAYNSKTGQRVIIPEGMRVVLNKDFEISEPISLKGSPILPIARTPEEVGRFEEELVGELKQTGEDLTNERAVAELDAELAEIQRSAMEEAEGPSTEQKVTAKEVIVPPDEVAEVEKGAKPLLEQEVTEIKAQETAPTAEERVLKPDLGKPKTPIEKAMVQQMDEMAAPAKTIEEEIAADKKAFSTRRRNRLIKETEQQIAESDIYQNELEALQMQPISRGYYFINESARGEVEAIIGKRKGPGTKLQRMFTFDKNETRIIKTPEGLAEIKPLAWDTAVQQALGRGKRGIEETEGHMDISDFVQAVVDDYESDATKGSLNVTALEAATESGEPFMAHQTEKLRMLREGFLPEEIDAMTREWAADMGIDEADIENEFIGDEPRKLKEIKLLEGQAQETALEALARENVLKQERQEAKRAVNEVLTANDIAVEVKEVEKIEPRKIQRDLLGKPVFDPMTTGKTQDLGIDKGEVSEKDVAINYELSQAVAKLANQNITETKEVAAELMGQKELFKNPANIMPEIRTAIREATEGRGLPFEVSRKPIDKKKAAIDRNKVVALRKAADSLTKQIEAKRNPAVAQQNITRRRAGQIASAAQDADRLERQQEALRAIVGAIEKGNLPESLSKVRARTDVEAILSRRFTLPDMHRTNYQDVLDATKGVRGTREAKETLRYIRISEHRATFTTAEEIKAIEKLIKIAESKGRRIYHDLTEGKRFMKLGIKDEGQRLKAQSELEQLMKPKSKEGDIERQIREKTHALIGVKIPGFFPTPKTVIDTMIERADIQEGMSVLEPSAGKGDIADAIREHAKGMEDMELGVVETQESLREILKLKEHQIVGRDFLEHTGMWQRIIMNPPFEKGQDIEHIQHAYELLKPGGKLVSIMSEGPFFNTQKKYQDFREWFDDVGGESEKLSQAFKGKEAFRQTGTTSRIVEIDKPYDDVPFEMRGEPVGAAITTPAGRQIVLLAYGADSETGYHEGYHTLREHLTDKDRRILDKRYKGDTEAEARAFAEYARTGKLKTGYLKAIWKKLVEKLKKIKSALQGKGYRTAEDIFGQIQTGKIKKAGAAAPGRQYETSGERMRRESERGARIRAEKERLKASIKPKVSRGRLKIELHDYTPSLPKMGQEPGAVGKRRPDRLKVKADVTATPKLGEEFEVAELPPSKLIEFRQTEFGPPPAANRRATKAELEENRRQQKRTGQAIRNLKQVSQSVRHSIEKRIASVSQRLANIDPELKRQVRLREERMAQRVHRDLKDKEGFVKKSRKMSKDDWSDFDYAAKVGDERVVARLASKYHMTEDIKKVREILDGLYQGGIETGMKINYRKDLWPRRVKDLEGLLDALVTQFGRSNILSPYQAAIARRKQQAGGRELTDDEKAQVLNSMMRGFGKRVWLSTPGVTKTRSLWDMTPELNKYYYDVRQSLERYIVDMHDAISAREFFGKTTENIQKLKAQRSRLATRLNKLQTRTGYKQTMTEPKYKEHLSTARERFAKVNQDLNDLQDMSVQDSIGAYVFGMVANGQLSPKQEVRINQILESYFQPKKMGRPTRLFKTGAYLTTIGSHLQALTQLKDYARIMYRAPLEAGPATARAIIPGLKSRYTMDELGIEATAMDIEGLSRVLDGVLSYTQFRLIDRKMKEVYTDAVLSKYMRQAKNPRHLKEGSTFRERIEAHMGKDAERTIKLLRAGKKTELTKRLAFNEVLDMHPVARSELTEQYLRGGGTTKALYTLRTFGMKEFEYARREILGGIKKHPGRNVGRLVWLGFTLALAGAGVEALRDLFRGRKPDLKDNVIDEWLRLILMSRYTVGIMKREGPARGYLRSLLPPSKIFDAPITDIARGEIKESPRLIPVVGEPYYWWYGEGKRKEQEKRDKEMGTIE